jgi:hypothetical protein
LRLGAGIDLGVCCQGVSLPLQRVESRSDGRLNRAKKSHSTWAAIRFLGYALARQKPVHTKVLLSSALLGWLDKLKMPMQYSIFDKN